MVFLLDANFVTKDGGEGRFLEGTFQKGEVVDVKYVTFRGFRCDSVQLDVVDLFANAEGVDGRFFLQTAGLHLEDGRVTGTPVGDEQDLVGHLWSVTEFRLESIVHDPFDR